MKKLLILAIILSLGCIGAVPSRQNTYVDGEIIEPSDVTANEDAIFDYLFDGVSVYEAGSIDISTDTDLTASSGVTLTGSALTNDLGTSIDIATETNLTASTNITLTTNDLAVDDAFLINDGDDTTTGAIYLESVYATGNVSGVVVYASGTVTGTVVDAQYLEYGGGTDITIRDNLVVNGTITENGNSLPDGSGTASYVTKWSDSNTLTDSVMYDDGTNVGIGTTAPTALLHVAGDANFVGTATATAFSGNLTGAVTGNADTCTTASEGDAAVDFFGAGVTSVTDATTCTDIEGTGLSIGGTTLNWAAASTDLSDTANIAYLNAANAFTNVGVNTFVGNVGIGTTTPTAALDIVGEAIINDDYSLNLGTGSPSNILWETADANANVLAIILPESGAVDVPVLVIGDATIKGTDLGDYDGENVPTLALYSDGGGSRMTLRHDGSDARWYSSAGDLILHPVGDDVVPNADNDVDLGTSSLRWKSLNLSSDAYIGGNVGIGVTAPLASLDVHNPTDSAVTIRMSNVGATGAGLYAYSATPTLVFSLTRNDLITGIADVGIGSYRGIGFQGGISTTPTTYDVYFAPDGNVGIGNTAPQALFHAGTAPSSGLFVKRSGNVGIGTTAPIVKLEVLQTANTEGIRVHSPDTATAGDYIEMYHNQTDGYVKSGAGQLRLSSTGTGIEFLDGETAGFRIKPFSGSNEILFLCYDSTGNQIVISTFTNRNDNSDHTPPTNPTLFIQSALSSTISNNQWGSLAHNQENFVISTGVNVGTGTSAATIDNALVIAPRGTEAMRVAGSGNVGIGNTAPLAKLHIMDSMIIPSGTAPTPAQTGGLFLDTDAGANGSLVIYSNSAWRVVQELP